MRTTEMVLFAHFLKTSKFIPACIYIYIIYIFELWRNYDLNNIKPKEVDNEDLAPVYQKIIGGVNITLSDVRKYLYSCTRLFVQEVDEDLKSVSKLHNSRGNQDITSDFV